MKKKDIIQLVKKLVKEGAYDSATLTTQGPPNSSRAVAPAGKDPYTGKNEYPFTRKPKSRLPGMMETQGSLSSDMLNYADQYHMELVDTMKGVSTHPDKRTGGFRIIFPHYNGPDYTGAMFGKDVSDKIERSKAAAKAAALKTYTKFQDQIEDYEITDKSRAGVHGSIHLWIMPKNNMNEGESPVKIGDILYKGGKKGKVIKVMSDMVNVDFGGGDVYGITFSRIKGDKITEKFTNKEKHINETKMKRKTIKEDISDDISKAEDEVQAATQAKADAESKVADAMKKKADAEKSSLEEQPLKENLAGVTAIGQRAMEEALASSNYRTAEDASAVFEEFKRGAYWALESLYNDLAPNAGAAPDEMMESYMKERGDDNLMEHMDKYRKRATLMEGATEKLFAMFNSGKTNDDVIHHYSLQRIEMPDSFVAKLRKNWEDMRKTKLELTLADKEAEGFNQTAAQSSQEMGMERGMEEKQLASGLKGI